MFGFPYPKGVAIFVISELGIDEGNNSAASWAIVGGGDEGGDGAPGRLPG